MNNLSGLRQQAKIGAIVLSVASAILTFAFGLYTNTNVALALTCAVALVVCSVASDYIWLFVADAWKAGRRVLVASLTIGAFLFTGVNLLTNLGSVGWQRDSANQSAKLVSVAYDDTRKQIDDTTALRAILVSERERLIKDRGWTAMVPSDSFNGRIEAAKLALEQEARRGGCAARCLERKRELAKLEDDKATALKLEKDEKQLTAIDAKLAKLKAQSASSRPEISAAKSQANFFAGLATVSLDPSDNAEQWTNKAIAILIAVFLVFGPQVLSFVAHRPDAPQRMTADDPMVIPPATAQPREQTTNIAVVTDLAAQNMIREAARRTIGRYASAA